MAKCKYILNGQTFDSELALENYLLSNRKLSDSDIVFKLSTENANTNEILNRTSKDANRLLKENKIKKDEIGYDVDADLDEIVAKYPSIGVTELIHKMHQASSLNPLFPIFRDDEYWARKKNDYINGIYDDEEKLLYFEQTGTDNTGLPIYEIPKTLTDEEFNRMRKLRMNYWHQQALIGIAVHHVFSIYFSLRSGTLVRDLDKESIRNIVKDVIKHNNTKDYIYLNKDKVIDNIIDSCILFKDRLLILFGKDAYIRTELKIVTEGSYNNDTIHIIGQLDLFILSNDPNSPQTAIIDFKCSPHHYSLTDPAKKRTFCYQLSVYRKILENLGIGRKYGIKLMIAPIQFNNFKYNKNNDLCSIEGITLNEPILQELEETEEYTESGLRIDNNLRLIFPYESIDTIDTTNLLNNVHDIMSHWFPVPTSWKDITPERIAYYIKSKGGILRDPGTNKWILLSKDKEHVLAESDKDNEDAATVEITQIISNNMTEAANNQVSATKRLRQHIRTALQGKEKLDLSRLRNKNGKSSGFVLELLSKFADGDKYELFEPSYNDGIIDILDNLGLLLFKNKQNGTIDVIQVSKFWDIFEEFPLGGLPNSNKRGDKKYLFGTYLSDIKSSTAPNALPLESVAGNIELMLAMSVINLLYPSFKGRNIRSIQVLKFNGDLQAITSTNKLLLYNFKKLCNLSKTSNFEVKNNFDKIKLLDNIEILKESLRSILKNKNKLSETIKESNSALINFERDLPDKEAILESLIQLKDELEKLYANLRKIPEDSYEYFNQPQVKLYFEIANAINEVYGIDLGQQIVDHDRLLLGGLQEALIERKGFSGNYTDNPGTLQNLNLNKLSELVTQAYLRVRDEVGNFNFELRERLNKYREAKNYTYLGRITFSNQVNLFMDLYQHNNDGTLNSKMLFKNPFKDNTLDDYDKDFLKFALLTFNKNRYPLEIRNILDLEVQLDGIDSEKYLRVPLSKGDIKSTLALSSTWWRGIKLKIKQYDSLEKIKTAVRDEILGEFEDETRIKMDRQELWEMANRFDRGEGNGREDFLRKGSDYFDLDLESLLLKHQTAYSLKRNMDKIFPMIKSIALNISYLSIIQNKNFSKDLQYVKDYVKGKIFNMPLDSVEDWGNIQFPVKKMQSIASKLALAYNPRQLYLNLDAIWKNISLFIRKPDGDTSFTAENLTKSFFWILKDLKHFGNKISLGEALNYTYGINDMDMNDLTSHLKSDTGGIFNFWNVGFRFASRPDYYNRMTIFGAQMMGDKCFEAHSMKDGKLFYDFYKDERFNLLTSKNKSNITEYNKQKAIYISMAQLFVKEGTNYPDGKQFIFDGENFPPLPRAYTNQLAESMKALADRIYGYYSHEKKSLILSYTLGGLFFLMATYFSSKKNLWLGREGFDQQGHLVQYEEDGKKYYLRFDSEGNLEIVDETLLSETESAIPYMVWKGRPQEGILITVAKVIKASLQNSEDGEAATLHNIFFSDENTTLDPDLIRLYRSNLLQLLYDLLMLLFFGSLFCPALTNGANDYYKNHGEEGLGEAVMSNIFMWQAGMVRASIDDFDPVHSVLGKTVLWTPFAISSSTRTLNNFAKFICGDRDTYDTFVNTFAATKEMKPIFNYIKMEELGRKIGDNGKEE